MKFHRYLASLFLLPLMMSSATAHHSTANFNFADDQRILLQGVITYWSFTNPHSFIDIDVTDDNGNTVPYKIFLTSRVALQRYGWRPKTLQAGDSVEIEGSPDKERPNEAYLQRITFADGKQWSRDDISL